MKKPRKQIERKLSGFVDMWAGVRIRDGGDSIPCSPGYARTSRANEREGFYIRVRHPRLLPALGSHSLTVPPLLLCFVTV